MSELPVTQINFRRGVIDLGMGNPDFALLPVELLHQSADEYFQAKDARPLQYGIEQGDGYLRQSLAGFLSLKYGDEVEPDSLFITAGASSALDLLCTLYTKPGDLIFVEQPTYFLALRIFEDHGLQVESIPMDAEGMRIDLLEQRLFEHTPKFIYTIPIFQNPSGRTLSTNRRQKLVEFALRDNFLVVADEAYQFLTFSQKQTESFAFYTPDNEQVISVNSFSKILAPGLRLGWIQAHDMVINRLSGCGLLESGGGMNPYTSALVRSLIESGGLEKNISSLQGEYSRRRDAMDVALRSHLPQAEYTIPEGGFFFWVKIPGVDAAELRSRAQEFLVDFRQGVLFSNQTGMREYLRLSFCFYGIEDLEDGIVRLRNCLRA
ncbi:MAG: PLP-dependent aminotransferase family protein [Anaerolineales bacterium]